MPGPRNGNGNHVGLAPPDTPVRAEYERDVYSWTQEQARLIRDGRWDLVDRDNVAEEIESLGRTEFNRLESAFRVLLLHMLKWDHQQRKRTRSWAVSIANQRIEIEDVLGDNPGLRSHIPEATTRAYRQARLLGAKETGLKDMRFSAECPYSWDDMTSREFSR
jgi:hypothetical protein